MLLPRGRVHMFDSTCVSSNVLLSINFCRTPRLTRCFGSDSVNLSPASSTMLVDNKLMSALVNM